MGTTGYYSSNIDPIVNKFDFYSGSQITVWFGNIWLDDINSIQWVRTQNKMPIYGYASQMFDSVANGIVTIQGTFTINFRQRGYIQAIMDNIKVLYQAFVPDSADAKSPYDSSTWSTVKDLIALHLKNGTFGPKSVQEIQELGNSTNFFEQAKLYESVIWGDTGLINPDKTREYSAADMMQASELPDGFNIMITYGNPSQNDLQTMRDHMQSTTKSLIGVHLVGESQIIQVGGQPVQEQYSFIARSTDEYIGTTR
jgi:hypothetical protein